MIETGRLILRPPQERDLEAVRAQLSSWDIAKWLAKVPHPYPPAHERTWWARVEERRALGFPPYHMMTLKGAGDEAIGCIAVSPATVGAFRLGYWLAEPHWGKGLMSEAVAAAVVHTFDVLKADAIVAGIFEGNEASGAILRKMGFEDVDVTSEWCEARQITLPHRNLVLKSRPKH